MFLAQLREDLVGRLSDGDTALDVIGSSGKLGGPGLFNININAQRIKIKTEITIRMKIKSGIKTRIRI